MYLSETWFKQVTVCLVFCFPPPLVPAKPYLIAPQTGDLTGVAQRGPHGTRSHAEEPCRGIAQRGPHGTEG